MSNISDFSGGGAKVWASGVTYKQGQVVLSPADNYQQYVRVTASGAGTTDPSADSTNYKPFGARACKSIQRGVITIPAASLTATATVSSVVTSKSKLRNLGTTGGSTDVATTALAHVQLTNSTTITATRGVTTATGGQVSMTVAWELDEDF